MMVNQEQTHNKVTIGIEWTDTEVGIEGLTLASELKFLAMILENNPEGFPEYNHNSKDSKLTLKWNKE